MSRRLLALPIAIGLLCSTASAQYIGIFTAPEAATCAVEAGPTPWIDLHVVAVLEGSITEITGAQFRITGAPEGWTTQNVLWVPEPTSAISLGNPLFTTTVYPVTGGVNVAFSTCQSRPGGGRVLLGRIVLLGAPTPGEVHLHVTGMPRYGGTPTPPLVTRCDAPFYTQVLIDGSEFVLNGPQPARCPEPTAIEPATWTHVRRLFE